MEALQQGLAAAAAHIQALDYNQRNYLTVAAAALGGAYLRLFVSRLSPAAGLLAVVPLLVVNCWLPLIFHIRDEVLTRAAWMLLLLWLANFKVRWTGAAAHVTRKAASSATPNAPLHMQAIGLCLRRGPLVGPWTIPQTILLYAMPIYPTQGWLVCRASITHGQPLQ